MISLGRGSYLYDNDGRQWLDMLSGILNVSLGHGHAVTNEAIRHVASTGLVNSYDRPNASATALRKLLGEYAPSYSWRLLNTGAEAIERAVQVVAHKLGRRPIVAVLPGSFHGKSLSMACIRYDAPWGNPMGVVTLDLHPDAPKQHFDVLIYEPVSGWDGTWNNPVAMRRLCDERGALLIADEMITGFGRCGFRFMNYGADMIVSGKGLSQGAPLAVLGLHESLDQNLSIGWNTTGGGNNLSATIGLHTLKYLMEHEANLNKRVKHIERVFERRNFGRVYGALAFHDLTQVQAAVRKVFEERHVIASWHDKVLRVGPNFYMDDIALDEFFETLAIAEGWV